MCNANIDPVVCPLSVTVERVKPFTLVSLLFLLLLSTVVIWCYL